MPVFVLSYEVLIIIIFVFLNPQKKSLGWLKITVIILMQWYTKSTHKSKKVLAPIVTHITRYVVNVSSRENYCGSK